MPESPPVINVAFPRSLSAAWYVAAWYCGRGFSLDSRPGLVWCCAGNGGLGRCWAESALDARDTILVGRTDCLVVMAKLLAVVLYSVSMNRADPRSRATSCALAGGTY